MDFSLKHSMIKLEYYLSGWKLVDERKDILIFENSDRMVLKPDMSTVYSIVKKNSVYTHAYFDYFLPLAFVKENPKILLIGLGAAQYPFN